MSDKKEIYEQLADMIEASSERIKICVPCQDYYSRSTDWTTDYINVINTDKLVQLLLRAGG